MFVLSRSYTSTLFIVTTYIEREKYYVGVPKKMEAMDALYFGLLNILPVDE